MKKHNENRLSERIYTLIKTNGLMLSENGRMRRQTFKEYQIFMERSKRNPKDILTESFKNEYYAYFVLTEKYDNKLLTSTIVEHINSNFNVKKLLTEQKRLLLEDDTVKNPETGRDIKISTALTYDPSHPAYKAAKAKVAKGGGHGEDDGSHGEGHGGGHGEHHGPKNLGKFGRVVSAVSDATIKTVSHFALHHNPVLGPLTAALAGNSEKIMDSMKEVVTSGKEVEGAINKAKAIGSSAKGMISKWGSKAKADFVNSLNDKNTGQRKTIGKAVLDKAKGVGKAIKEGGKKEFQHLASQFKDGADAAKMVGRGIKEGNIKEVLKSDEFKEKATSGIQGIGTSVVLGLAVASGPAGMALKAGVLALNPGDAISQIMTADIYFDLQRKGKLNVIKESVKRKSIRILESEIDKKIDSMDEEFVWDLMTSEGSKELQRVKDPMNDYTEDEMDIVVGQTQFADEITDMKRKQSKSTNEHLEYRNYFEI